MSKPEDNPTPITIAGETVENVVAEKRPNILVRGYRKAKSTDPKTAFAVLGGTALVGAAAYLGRKTAPSCDAEIHVITEDDLMSYVDVEEPDTTVA